MTFAGVLEPWPAVLLPSGGGLVAVESGTVRFAVIELTAIDRSGKEQRIDPVALIEPIPPQNFRALSEHRFGHDLTLIRSVETTEGKPLLDFMRTAPSPSELEEATRWLAQRVRRSQRSATHLAIRRDWLTVEIATGRELTRHRESEALVPLL